MGRWPDLMHPGKSAGWLSDLESAKLPRISLMGSVSGASDVFSELTNSVNIFWNAVAGLMFPILDGGKLDA